ncbi:hypothetical protein MHM98_09910 [Psychrobium sp. MM17-31]|uniref:hypothetical protein n=1 Tax=Psychrobium sp. MM17-31 TaxID=2917758 RepID=UPI001EF5B502|nr:hypothetical protein [Psychrobium sp. MM17-31]MCG7531654.1 hypothetical protein [Psychrobium sp. MM17-31]
MELLTIESVITGVLEFVIMFLTAHLFYKFRRLSIEQENVVFRHLSNGFLCSLILFVGPIVLTLSAGFWVTEANMDVLSMLQDTLYFLFSFLGIFFFYKAANKAFKES